MPTSTQPLPDPSNIDHSLAMRREIRDITQRIEQTLTAGNDERAIKTVCLLQLVLELKREQLTTMQEQASA